jgi:hypothetical protein
MKLLRDIVNHCADFFACCVLGDINWHRDMKRDVTERQRQLEAIP